jgi:hypothetical protein
MQRHIYLDESDDSEPKPSYWEVIVENVGTIYHGTSRDDAQRWYDSYLNYHPFGFDDSVTVDVTLMCDNEIISERRGNLSAGG